MISNIVVTFTLLLYQQFPTASPTNLPYPNGKFFQMF